MSRTVVTRKLAAIAAASATLLAGAALGVSAANAAAAPTQDSNDIVVTSSTGATLKNRSLKAYKIASYSDVTYDKDGQVEGFDLHSSISDDALKAALQTVTGKTWDELHVGADANSSPIQYVADHFQGTTVDDKGNTVLAKDDVYGNKRAGSELMRQFVDALRKQDPSAFAAGDAVTGTVSVVTPDDPNTPENEEKDAVTFDVPTDGEGIYVIQDETKAQEPGETESLAMLLGSPFKADGFDANAPKYVVNLANGQTVGSLFLKADKVVISKTTDESPVTLDSKRTFTVTANVPLDYAYYTKNISYVITDNPTDNILGRDNLTVTTDGGKTTLAEGTDYEVADVPAGQDGADDPNDFTVTLKDPKALAGKTIVVTYDSTVDSLVDKMGNDVKVDYTNSSYTDGTGETTETHQNVYQADLALKKTDIADATKNLAGAQFTVTKGDNNDAVSWAKDGDTYTESNRANSGRASVVTTGADGSLNLKGLAADADAAVTYHFEETAAPAGYRLGDHVKFDVTLTPVFDANGRLTKIQYKLVSANNGQFNNFLDLNKGAEGELSLDNTVEVNAPEQGAASTILAKSMTVENTKNPSDFAPTGAALLQYVAAIIVLSAAGGTMLYAAKRHGKDKGQAIAA
ncbi:SpaA isopeptide-forming pilin-related protein [Bifidobacterium olomucense]|uniref:Fimbrial subunit FimA n=1 Tax=Bifidobacterium olomucense TaxID=2675324 RepID=A0A7Y0EW70_9BIFI|nr:SpaA isopeptide-forming pilin-related protein [Bifidobacterium sp. DSM 109959]NMM97538.1 fimbrial subunit FimA [Bifidobacterium sp. DSM 109959]